MGDGRREKRRLPGSPLKPLASLRAKTPTQLTTAQGLSLPTAVFGTLTKNPFTEKGSVQCPPRPVASGFITLQLHPRQGGSHSSLLSDERKGEGSFLATFELYLENHQKHHTWLQLRHSLLPFSWRLETPVPIPPLKHLLLSSKGLPFSSTLTLKPILNYL